MKRSLIRAGTPDSVPKWIRKASVSISPPPASAHLDAHVAPAVGQRRAPATQGEAFTDLDGFEHVDHHPANHPPEMGSAVLDSVEMLEPDVLQVAGDSVQAQASVGGSVGNMDRPSGLERCSLGWRGRKHVGNDHERMVPDICQC